MYNRRITTTYIEKKEKAMKFLKFPRLNRRGQISPELAEWARIEFKNDSDWALNEYLRTGQVPQYRIK